MEHSLQKREAITLRSWGSKAETGKATGQPTLNPSAASPRGSLFIPGAVPCWVLSEPLGDPRGH